MQSQIVRLIREGSLPILVVVGLVCFCGHVFAREQEPNKTEDFLEMSLEELMEVPVVVSASRQEQKITESSVPISIIAAEDIHYSGLTTIPDILRFAPSVDVLQLDRNRFAVGVRGLHSYFSDRTLVLVNGRAVSNFLVSGVEWDLLPVLIEDIDRIEIVRGPGGAAWGANAFTGVINIITKKPEDVLGLFGSTTINEFGDSYTHLRWGERKDKWSWRVSAGYEDKESSEDAIEGKASYKSLMPGTDLLTGFNSYVARDFSRSWRFDTEAIYQYSDNTRFSLGIGHSNIESGDCEYAGLFPKKDAHRRTTRLYSRIDHDFDDGGSGYLQWFGNFSLYSAPSLLGRAVMRENDIEAMMNFAPVGKHNISIGGNVRWWHVNTETDDPPEEATIHGEPVDETWVGLFAIDRWLVNDRLTLEGQIRGDWYSETTTDWSARGTALYSLDEQKDHVLRFSAARAFRVPVGGFRRSTLSRINFMGTYLFNVILPTKELENEHTWSIEAGYTGKIAKDLTLRVDTYYQRFEHLIGIVNTYITPSVVETEIVNIAGGDSYGVECELAKRFKKGKLSAWYAYNYFEPDRTHQALRSHLPAQHKAGLTGRLFLDKNWTFNANYKFTDTTCVDPITSLYDNASDFKANHRLDLTLSRKIAEGRGELMIGVSDLFNKTYDPAFAVQALAVHETPGRMFFARLQLRF